MSAIAHNFISNVNLLNLRHLKRPLSRFFLLVTTEGDLFDNQIKSFLKISFASKCDYSLLQILLTTLFLG